MDKSIFLLFFPYLISVFCVFSVFSVTLWLILLHSAFRVKH